MVRKEAYLTKENRDDKVKEWLKSLDEYTRDSKFSHNNSALIVVDMQSYFIDQDSHAAIKNPEVILENIAGLVAAYRSQNKPVIFTKFLVKKDEDIGMMGKWWSDTVYEGEPRSEIVDELKPATGELVITKKDYGCFGNKELKDYLEKNNIENIVIVGVATDMCCDVTARESFLNGFQPEIVIDATAASNEELHLSTLRVLGHGFAYLRTTKEILEVFNNA